MAPLVRGAWVQFLLPPPTQDALAGKRHLRSSRFLHWQDSGPRDLQECQQHSGTQAVVHTKDSRARGVEISHATLAMWTNRWSLSFLAFFKILLVLFLSFVKYLSWLCITFMQVNIIFSFPGSLQNLLAFSSNTSPICPTIIRNLNGQPVPPNLAPTVLNLVHLSILPPIHLKPSTNNRIK